MTHCRQNVCVVTEAWQIKFHNPLVLPQDLSTSDLGQADERKIETSSLAVQRPYCCDSLRENLGCLG